MKPIHLLRNTLNRFCYKCTFIPLYLLLGVFGLPVFAQEGLEGIIVEKIPVTALAAADDPNLPSNAIAYRVFIDLSPDFEMQAVFAETNTSIVFNTTTKFYNNGDLGGTTGKEILTSLLAENPALAFDSYITVNAATNNRLGILMEEDTTDGIVDGLTAGSFLSLQVIGADFDTPFGNNDFEGLFTASDCAYNVNGGEVGPTASNRVLIGQFTTDGEFTFKINIQLRKRGEGIFEQYVAADPAGLQYQHPELHYPGPLVQITTPTNGILVPSGQNLTIEASASSYFGINDVSFFINETKASTDSTSPFTTSWLTAAEGSVSFRAVATDSLGASDTSEVVTITVGSLVAPAISITSPSAATEVEVNSAVVITAEASDTDGSIALVEFFANDTKIGEDQIAPYQVSWTPTVTGSVDLHAAARDNDGLTTVSATVTISVDQASGINNLGNEEMIIIYPNPAHEAFTITLHGDHLEADYQLEIIGMQGKALLNRPVNLSQGSGSFIDISTLPKGVYHIRLTGKNGETFRRILVKN